MPENNIEITAYLKTHCGWSEGVRAIMRKHSLDFEEKDIIANPAFRWEMEQRSGQPLSPCVVVNDVMLPDVSGDEVEAYLAEITEESPVAHFIKEVQIEKLALLENARGFRITR